MDLEGFGEIPEQHGDWGRFEDHLTLAWQPGSDFFVLGLDLVVIAFHLDKPLNIDSDTPLSVIMEDDRTCGISFFQTAYVNRHLFNGDVELALRYLWITMDNIPKLRVIVQIEDNLGFSNN